MQIVNFKPLVFLAVCVVGIWAAETSTHKPRESGEVETIAFSYNGHSHSLIIITRVGRDVKCYVITLTDDERAVVHTDAGMRTVELKYLAMLSIAKTTTVDTLNNFDKRACGHAPRNNGTIEYFAM